MACITMKRSLDFDPIHPVGSPRPHKRRRCIPMCVSPQSAATANSICQAQPNSHFINATSSVTPQQIAQNVREEFRRLKRRKLLHGEKGMDCEAEYELPVSPQSPPSPSLNLATSSITGLSSPGSSSNKDKPLFTFRQVNLICEQLLRDREVKIREDYDKVLSTKLSEQYDCFVKFTADQIQQRLNLQALPSSYEFVRDIARQTSAGVMIE